MSDKKKEQLDRIMRFNSLISKQTGKAVRPFRQDGYYNLLTRYGTEKDSSEQYRFAAEPIVPDELLTTYYEGNGLFAKIIDTPAEEAIKHGFTLEGVADNKIIDFYTEALDELDWDETAMTALRWMRLFGGSIIVMLINDGRGIDEPLDWKNIISIDDLRVFDRSQISPELQSMYIYDPQDPFFTRGSRLGMPEHFYINSRYGNFKVHESRCLTFHNGILPENTTNSIYQLWGMPEYVRINKAIRDAEVAHGSATKMLDRAIQAVYKMKGLSQELATEEGESLILKRLQTIDMARGLLNSITIDGEGEEYEFRTFQFTGVSEVIDSTCNFLSALTSIPQTILFGRSPAGMNSTGEGDMENYYNFVERVQRRCVRSNLRYLLSIIFQAGLSTQEVDEMPKIKIEFNPLWNLSESEKASLEQQKAQTKMTKAQTAQIYVDMQALDPQEVRKKLADSEEFDVDTILDEVDEEDLMAMYENEEGEESQVNPEGDGNSPDAAPEATKLPEDMDEEAKENVIKNTDSEDCGSVGVTVIKDGKILIGTRHSACGYGEICGPGGHIEPAESAEEAAIRETREEFGITPLTLMKIGIGPEEKDTGLAPNLYLCTEYKGEPKCSSLEMSDAKFESITNLLSGSLKLFKPFEDGLHTLLNTIYHADSAEADGGPGSGNFNHEGRPGEVGGSGPSDISCESIKATAPKGVACSKMTKRRYNERLTSIFSAGSSEDASYEGKKLLESLPKGSEITLPDHWNDNGVGDKLVKQDDGKWRCANSEWHYVIDDDEIISYMGADSHDNPTVTKVAMTQEAKDADLRRWDESNWRNQDNTWAAEGSFETPKTIKLRKRDIDHCGDGFKLVGSDGRTYEKVDGKWYDSKTFRECDMRKLKSPEFTGDFYYVNFGMNGVSKEACDDMRLRMSSIDEEQRTMYEQAFRNTTFEACSSGTSHFSPWSNTVSFDTDTDSETIIHELSHKLDSSAFPEMEYQREGYTVSVMSASQFMDLEALDSSSDDFESMAKVVGFETNGEGWFAGKHSTDDDDFECFHERFKAYSEFAKKYEHIEGFGSVSDMISALTITNCGEAMFGAHEQEYWMKPHGGSISSNRSIEFFSEYCTLRAFKYEEALDLAKQIAPNMFAAAEKAYGMVFGNE